MYPNQIAEHCAITKLGKIEFPETAGWTQGSYSHVTRVTMRGGSYFDAPAVATIHLTRTARQHVAVLSHQNALPVICDLTRPKASVMPYSYFAYNNRGAQRNYSGYHTVTEAQAELIGWLLNDGNLFDAGQSIRFTNSDQATLHRVQMLCKKAFPTLQTKWYAKNGAYDITMTGGIDNPLKHFVRMLDFYHGCPMAVGRYFNTDCTKAFLRGVWGSKGWVYVRKGGNDVIFGLARSHNEYGFSWLRLLHAGLGLQGSREQNKKGASRLVFNGFRNYSVFMREIGQFGTSKLPAVPVRKTTPAPTTYLANHGETWYDAAVTKIQHLAQPATLYRV